MDFNTQDTRSFDSYMSSPASPAGQENYFTLLPLLDTAKRTRQLASRFARARFVPWTAAILTPCFVIAFFTAAFHNSQKDIVDHTVFVTLTAFDEIRDALPLVIWQALVMSVGSLLAQSVIVQFLLEVVYGDRLPPTPWRKAIKSTLSRHGKTLATAMLFIVGSLTTVYVVGHFLTVELVHMRQDALHAKHKDLIFGCIALAAAFMVLCVDMVVIFCLVWLVCLYANLLPIVLMEQPEDPVELFRIAYVLSRDSRSYLTASWALACLPGILASLLIGLPLYLAFRREGQDFVEWQFGTSSGIFAAYLPLLIWIPVLAT